MIDVEEKRMPMIAIGRMMFKCPFCKVEISFYASIIHYCTHCKNSVINIIALENDSNYRLAYHFGTIDLKGQRVK